MDAPLIVTRDHTLREELTRLAAAAGVVPVVVGDAREALRRWALTPLVLLGVDLAEQVAELGPPRRVALHLVAWGRIPDRLFRTAVELGAENLAELPQSDAWLLELLAEAGEGVSAEGTTIAVAAGSGGAGATTFACALSIVAASRGPTCLVDGDPSGPGADRVLGRDRLEGVRWDALQQTSGRLSARSLRESLPRQRGLGVLTWTPGPQGTLQAFAAREVLAAASRGHDTVVLDLPRTPDATVEELMGRCRHRLVVVRATVPGLASAARFVARTGRAGPVGLVVRGVGIDAAEVSRVVAAPVVAVMSDQRGLEESVDLGLGPLHHRRGALARAARATLQGLSGPETPRRAA